MDYKNLPEKLIESRNEGKGPCSGHSSNRIFWHKSHPKIITKVYNRWPFLKIKLF